MSARYKVDDSVRVNKFKTVIEKSLKKITRRIGRRCLKLSKQQTNPVTYLLEDSCGEPIARVFYEYEFHRYIHIKHIIHKIQICFIYIDNI